MSYNITQEEIERLKGDVGEVRGVVFKTDEHFVLKNGGEEKLKEVEIDLKLMGVDLNYKEIDRMDFYPLSWRVFSLLAIARVFNYNKEQVKEMGFRAPRVSFLIKFFTKYFMSSQKTLEKVEEMWGKHYTKGRVEAVEIDEEAGKAIFRLHESSLHPILCDYLLGYFSSVISMVVGEKVDSRETKCYFNSNEFHEFYMTWKSSTK